MVRGSLAVKGRMLVALFAIVALNAAFVAVVSWLYLVVLPTFVAGAYLLVVDGAAPGLSELVRLPMAPRWLAVLTLAFLGGQIYYGYTRVLDDVRAGAVSESEYPVLHGVVGRLATAADVPKPDVAVVQADRPNSFTVGRGHAATIVVTAPLLDLLDEAELEAVLAHEIAHVRHRDVTLMTVTGLFVAIAERALRTARLLRRGVTDPDRVSAGQRLAFDWLFPVVLFTYVFAAPVLWLFPPVARFASGELSRQREFAADRAAAKLTGAPTALARALVRVHEATPDVAETDLRTEYAALRALCVVPYGLTVVDGEAAAEPPTARWIGAPAHDVEREADSSDAEDRAAGASGHVDAVEPDDPVDAVDPEAWLGTTLSDDVTGAHTHPPIDRRVERLVEMEA